MFALKYACAQQIFIVEISLKTVPKRELPRMAAVCNGVSPLVFFLEIFFKSRSTVGELLFCEKMVRRNEVEEGVVPLDEDLDEEEGLSDDEVLDEVALTLAPFASVTT